MSAAPVATIVVCTRNHARLLDDCVRSILADGAVTPREILIVDNDSTDDTPQVARALAALGDTPVRYVREPRLGHSHARNRGVLEARGELLLFTDDDVRVERGWTDALAAAFDDPRVGAAGGRILPEWPQEPPPWLNGPHAELLTLIDYGERARPFEPGETPLGASMATRTSIARRFDEPFDTRLGHRGDRRMAHEEVHYMNRVRETHTAVYRPDAVLRHRVGRERMDLNWMRATFVDLGIGLGRRERFEHAVQLGVVRRLVRAFRTYRGARTLHHLNDRRERVGPETWDELNAHMWAARHVELLLGGWPSLSERIARTLA